MVWNRNRTILGVAAAAAAGVGYYAVQMMRSGRGLELLTGRRRRASTGTSGSAALSGDGADGAVGNSGAARQAGPEAMRDPPERWGAVDEASDESFPASDPPAVKHVD